MFDANLGARAVDSSEMDITRQAKMVIKSWDMMNRYGGYQTVMVSALTQDQAEGVMAEVKRLRPDVKVAVWGGK